ncbi:MAG: LysR family transcriptional regulator [Nevskia sp.]|nr:LysR family transcriptional regulator [Nevskia sp.]
MLKMSIKPQWQLERGDNRQLMPHLVSLLAKVHETHTLAEASLQMGLSYRYAWGLLQEGQRAFGVPLVKMARGRGALLTPLGEKLVWADKRITARLTPLLDSLASELEVEVERALSHAPSNILRLHASHGFAVQTLRQWLLREQVPIDLKYRNVQEALGSLNRGSCDLAGFHVPQGELEPAALQHYLKALRPDKHRLVHLATRRQGLMVAPRNPRNITGIGDLARPGISYVNRHEGSGTRLLLDLLLRRERLDGRNIQGYDSCEFTHAAVAAYVASGMADAGLGVEPAARRFELDFLPLASERYFFVCHVKLLETPMMQRILDTLRSREFQRAVNALPGYDSGHCGSVLNLAEAFPQLPRGPAGAGAGAKRSKIDRRGQDAATQHEA